MITTGGTLRWGILGTAKIARTKVIPAMQAAARTEVAAIASRDAVQAARVASELGIGASYGSYAALLADPEIDAVYIPLPNEQHVPVAIMALEAGKHVLVEKPLALDAPVAQRLADAADRHPDRVVAEGWMYRHHPQWVEARALVRGGAVGRVGAIVTHFSYYNDDPANIRNRPEHGGGALLDIGCYPVSLSRFLLECEPESVQAVQQIDPAFGTDRATSALMQFGGVTSLFTCSTRQAPGQRVQIFGEEGSIEIEIPFNAPPDRETRLWLQPRGEARREIRFAPCDQYTLQAEAFAGLVFDGGANPWPVDDGVANMRVIDALVRSAASGRREPVAAD